MSVADDLDAARRRQQVLDWETNERRLASQPAATPADRHAQLVSAANRPRVGRIQRRVHHALIIAGKPMLTADIIRKVYPGPIKHWHYRQVRELALRFAEPVRRVARPGCPVLWRLRE